MLLKLLSAALVVVLLVCAGGWLVLKRGVELDSIALGPVEISDFSLHLQRKLSLDIAELRVNAVTGGSSDTAQSKPEIDPTVVRDALRGIRWLATLFKSIDIRQIAVQDLRGSFLYRENGPGHLRLEADDTEIDLDMSTEDGTILVDIESARIMGSAIQLTGSLALDTEKRQLQSHLEAVVGETLPVSLEIEADSKQLSFHGRGEQLIDNLRPVVEIFDLGPSINPWIIDYLVGSEIELEEVSGTIPFADPAAILHTLYAAATVKDVAYTFAQGLDPVFAPEVQLVFEKGVLHIYPKQATFYGQGAGSTYVDVDFTGEHFFVLVYVRTTAQASGGINTLLDFYGIPFPFVQTEGLADVDLTVAIDLKTVGITADGRFKARDSQFVFDDMLLDVAALDIELATKKLTFNELRLAMGDLLSVNLTGKFDAGSMLGELQAALDSFQWQTGDTMVKLDASPAQPRTVAVHLDAAGNSLDIPETAWQFGEHQLRVNAFSTPLNSSPVSGIIPPTDVFLDGNVHAIVKGEFSETVPYARLQLGLIRLSGDKLKLAQKNANLGLRVGKDIRVATSKPVKFDLQGVELLLQPSNIVYQNGSLDILKSGLSIPGVLDTGLEGEVNIGDGSGKLYLSGLGMNMRGGKPGFFTRQATLRLSSNEDGVRVLSPELGLEFNAAADGGWRLECPDLGTLHTHSSLLKSQKLEQGEFQLRSPSGSSRILFEGSLYYPYALLMQDDQPVNQYHFKGWYDGGRSDLTLNDHVDVEFGDQLKFTSRGVGYNVPELSRLMEDASKTAGDDQGGKSTPDEAKSGVENEAVAVAAPGKGDDVVQAGQDIGHAEEPEGVRLLIDAHDTYLWLDKDHRIVADRLQLDVMGEQATLELRHHNGNANLEYDTGQINMIGQGFDHEFIGHIVTLLADVDRGTLEFRLKGTLDEFDAVLAIRDTVVRDFKALNNMLAFINTLPGLVTFNPPDYDTKGLPAKEISAALTYKAGVMDLSSMLVDSKELTVRGSGELNFNDNTTDMTFNLVSGAKKSISRIPLLGFILEGDEEKTAIALMVQGDMQDPEVSSTTFEEVASYPFKVLARTLLLPVHLVQESQDQRVDPDTETTP